MIYHSLLIVTIKTLGAILEISGIEFTEEIIKIFFIDHREFRISDEFQL